MSDTDTGKTDADKTDVGTDRGAAAAIELVGLRAAVLDDFLVVTSDVTDTLRSMQQSPSWRVSRPLRRVRSVQRKVTQVGVPRAGRIALGLAAKKLGR